jgi:hypothetical protein
MPAELIVFLSIVGAILLGLIGFMIFTFGQLSGSKDFLRYLERQASWSSVRLAQANFNFDFFDELYAQKDKRLSVIEGSNAGF